MPKKDNSKLTQLEKGILEFLTEHKGQKFYSDEIADELNINSAWTVFKTCNRLHDRGLIK